MLHPVLQSHHISISQCANAQTQNFCSDIFSIATVKHRLQNDHQYRHSCRFALGNATPCTSITSHIYIFNAPMLKHRISARIFSALRPSKHRLQNDHQYRHSCRFALGNATPCTSITSHIYIFNAPMLKHRISARIFSALRPSKHRLQNDHQYRHSCRFALGNATPCTSITSHIYIFNAPMLKHRISARIFSALRPSKHRLQNDHQYRHSCRFAFHCVQLEY